MQRSCTCAGCPRAFDDEIYAEHSGGTERPFGRNGKTRCKECNRHAWHAHNRAASESCDHGGKGNKPDRTRSKCHGKVMVLR